MDKSNNSEATEKSMQKEFGKTPPKLTEKSLRDFLPELITSLLYASAISSMLSYSMSLTELKFGILSIFNTFIIVVLVFADWNNRILVPLHFPGNDLIEQRKSISQYLKLIFEIMSMVFLVMFYRAFIIGNYETVGTINIYILFTCYLVSCGVWNFIMIKIMNDLDLKPLLKSIINGSVFDLDHLGSYTKNFSEKLKEKERLFNIKFKDEINNESIDNERSADDYKKNKRLLRIEKNIARTIAQFVGNHILWTNFFVGLILILNSQNINTSIKLMDIEIYSNYTLPGFYLKLFIIGGILLLIGFRLFYIIRKHEMDDSRIKKQYGILFLLFLLILYIFVPINILIYLMIIQQILIGLLIEYITDGKNNLQTQKV